MTTFTQTDNRDHAALESYYLDSIKALRAEVKRLMAENKTLREGRDAFCDRLSEVLKKNAERNKNVGT